MNIETTEKIDSRTTPIKILDIGVMRQSLKITMLKKLKHKIDHFIREQETNIGQKKKSMRKRLEKS